MRSGKWAELPITKSPKIVHVAVGHESLHAILLAEDGSVFFVGTARRGEDGDQSKDSSLYKGCLVTSIFRFNIDGAVNIHSI